MFTIKLALWLTFLKLNSISFNSSGMTICNFTFYTSAIITFGLLYLLNALWHLRVRGDIKFCGNHFIACYQNYSRKWVFVSTMFILFFLKKKNLTKSQLFSVILANTLSSILIVLQIFKWLIFYLGTLIYSWLNGSFNKSHKTQLRKCLDKIWKFK